MTKLNIILELSQALNQYDQGEGAFTEMRANGTLDEQSYLRKKEDNADDFINAIRSFTERLASEYDKQISKDNKCNDSCVDYIINYNGNNGNILYVLFNINRTSKQRTYTVRHLLLNYILWKNLIDTNKT